MIKPFHIVGVVYILTNKNHTVLYTGVTSNLFVRMQQHISKYYPNSFSAKYNATKLVYYKQFETIELAISEEKRIKAGNRQQKMDLINSVNASWIDLWLTDVSKW
jgi:putative endonuclease